MEGFIKVGTSHTFQMGPFLDDTTGKDAEPSLTIAYTDVFLSKQGGAFAAKADTTNLTGTGDTRGYYDCVLGTGDTDTEGTLKVCAHISGALPVWHTFQVLNAVAYEAIFSDAGDDYLQVDILQCGGNTVAAGAIPNAAAGASGGIPTVDASNAVKVQSGTGANQISLSSGLVALQSNQAVNVTQWGSQNIHTVSENGVPVVDVHKWNGTDVHAPNTAGIPIIEIHDPSGVTIGTVTAVTNDVGITQAGADKVWGTAARALTDKAGFSISGTKQTLDALNDIAASAVWAVGTKEITGGTVTNLTNAPSNGDFTATMKTSLNAATPSVTVSDKTGFSLSSAGIDSILDEVCEDTHTMREMLRAIFCVLAAKSTGGGTSSLKFRDHADSKDRVTATVDSDGNRTAVTLDLT